MTPVIKAVELNLHNHLFQPLPQVLPILNRHNLVVLAMLEQNRRLGHILRPPRYAHYRVQLFCQR